MLLVLLDVDGTLFLTDDALVGEATAEAAREVWGIELAPDCLAEPLHDGGLALARFFPKGQGAFGCDAEERARLIGIARERAGGWPREETVAVGDTKADVAGAHAAGIRIVGVHGDPEALAGADARISSLSSLPEALSSLRP